MECSFNNPACVSYFRDVDSSRTYCDYTLQFVVRIHGFPISPMRSIRIVLVRIQYFYTCREKSAKRVFRLSYIWNPFPKELLNVFKALWRTSVGSLHTIAPSGVPQRVLEVSETFVEGSRAIGSHIMGQRRTFLAPFFF